jgi:hypothetical protein
MYIHTFSLRMADIMTSPEYRSFLLGHSVCSSVGKVIGYELDDRDSTSDRGETFLPTPELIRFAIQ